MLNLVEKFTPEAIEATEDEGAVTIEYVVLAVFVVTLSAAFVALGMPARLATVLDGTF